MDDIMRVDLDPTVSLSVNSDTTIVGHVAVAASVDGSLKIDGGTLTVKTEGGSLTTEPCFFLLPIQKPYLINKDHIECIVGEWNKDKTKYGIRIFFVSGNNVYLEGAAGISTLGQLGGKVAFDKFMSYARSSNERGDEK